MGERLLVGDEQLQRQTLVNLPRLMLAAPGSGSGKTLITCGLLQVLKNRAKAVAAFKCGPDYIDPMFHTRVLDVPSINLDTFFASPRMVRYLFARRAMTAEISVMEGVMGFFDGVAGVTTQASSWELADETKTPVILIVPAKGMSLSLIPLISGFLSATVQGEKDSWIRGVILNQVSASFYPELKQAIEAALPIKVLGYVPKVEDCVIESRHLGLVTPEEILGLQEKLQKLADILENTLDIEGILALAESALPLFVDVPEEVPQRTTIFSGNLRIAVARDEAFCFYYEDNLELLERFGAELVYFSPLHDSRLPENTDALLLGGGYPELYAQSLSQNVAMLQDIRENIAAGLPYLAECGGFMYLHETMEDMAGRAWPMVGVISGRAYGTKRLGRFGYITLTANVEQIFGEAGSRICAHEFHYFDSTTNGEAFHAQKPGRKRSWDCVVAGKDFAAGFPHLYYYANPEFVRRFLERTRERTARSTEKT